MSKEAGKKGGRAVVRAILGILSVAVALATRGTGAGFSPESGSGGGNQPLSGGCPRMVFESAVEDEGEAIWSAPVEGGAAIKIWSGPDPTRMSNLAVHMSPDCTEVLIEHFESDPFRSTILVARVDKYGARELVVPAEGEARNPVWSPDGQHIYYIREYSHPLPEPHSELWRIGRDGTGDTMLLNLGDVFVPTPTLLPSPNGSHLLATVNVHIPGVEREIYSLWLIDLAQRTVTPIYTGTPERGAGLGVFSPDGRYVAYTLSYLVSPPDETDFWETELRIRDLVTGEDRVVAPRLSRQQWLIPPLDDYRSLWSEDGSEFLGLLASVDDPDGDIANETAIYRIPVDGSGPILVRPAADCEISEAGWTADRSRIRFLEDCALLDPPGGPVGIKSILPDGSGETVIPVTIPGEFLRANLLHR